MAQQSIAEIFSVLPPAQQQELLDFADYLIKKYSDTQSKSLHKRQAGTMKGLVQFMAEDFNAPLQDFNAYM
ncbi:MAG: DUF2281 domain-containing protein [Chitinophagales bacterium]|nr:DUF2281 domain-containing protein [Chitinophagales bacterium]